MKVEIHRGKASSVVYGTKIRIQVYPYASVVIVGTSHYPVLQGQSVTITDEDEGLGELVAAGPKAPKLQQRKSSL